jgi:hypothetical protein
VTAMVQAQSLRGYRELVNDLGGNPTRLLRKRASSLRISTSLPRLSALPV